MARQRKIHTFFIESLGCAKNTVDAHAIERTLRRSGYQAVGESWQADVIIVNTCGFIRPAREESIQVLKEYANGKKPAQFLIAAGCMSEWEKDGLQDLVPGIDAALSTRRWMDMPKIIHHLESNPPSPYFYFPDTEKILASPDGLNHFAIQGKSAFLKIADGCDRRCAYCAIPKIKGPMVSRPIEKVIQDIRTLEAAEIQEVILIAQDSTAYGRDLGFKEGLSKLLDQIVKNAPGIPWLRIMYTFPDSITDMFIEIMANNEQVLPYLDVPLQHAHPEVLRRMGRPSDMDSVKRRLFGMREKMPNLALRTTFIVGSPGETVSEFEHLCDFIREVKFDHIGIFPYYHEPGTSAYALNDSVPEHIKQDRLTHLAHIQEGISLKRNEALIGAEINVLIESNTAEHSIGRSYRDAPEVDGLVYINQIVEPGRMVTARVTGAMIHDLIADKR